MTIAAPRHLLPGDKVGRYRVTAVLGGGGGAEVYGIIHEDLQLHRALKVPRQLGPEAARRLVSEGRLQAGLKHPNLVGVIDVIELRGGPALVLELAEGPTLAELLRDAPPLPAEALRLFDQVLAGMACAHAAGIVHRDLKPANVVLDLASGCPVARVTDFGIASSSGTPTDSRPSRGVSGTPAWCAPEVLEGGGEPDPRVDVYALGVLLYVLTTGQHPFPQADPAALLAAKRAERFPDLAGLLPPDLPAEIAPTIARCMRAQADERPADAAAVQRLLSAADGPGAQASPRRAPPSLALGLAAALVVSLGLGAWSTLRWQAEAGRARAAELQLAASRIQARDPAAAVALLRAAAAVAEDDALEPRLAARLLDRGAVLRRLDRPGHLAVQVALSDRLVALADDEPSIRVYDRATGALHARVPSPFTRPAHLALDPAGRWVVATALVDPAEAQSPVGAWRLPDAQPLATAPGSPAWLYAHPTVPGLVLQVHDQADGRRGLALRQLPGGETRWRSELDGSGLAHFSGDGRSVIVTETDAHPRVLSVEDGSLQVEPEDARRRLISPGGDRAAQVHHSGDTELIDTVSGSTIGRLEGVSRRLTFSTGGDYLAGLTEAGALFALAPGSSQDLLRWPGTEPARLLRALPEGFLVGTSSGAVHRWDPLGHERQLVGLTSRIISAAQHDGTIVASDLGGRVGLWSDDADPSGITQRRTSAGAATHWGARADRLYAATTTGLEVVEADGRHTALPELPPTAPVEQAFVVGRSLVLTSAQGGRSLSLPAEIWGMPRAVMRLSTGTVIAGSGRATLVDDHGEIRWEEALHQVGTGLLLSGDRVLLTHGARAALSVLDASGQIVASAYADTEQAISSVAVSDDGVIVAGTFCGRLLRFSDGPERQLLTTESAISTLALHGSRVAAGTWEGELVVVDGQEELWRTALPAQVVDLAWDPDGRWLVAADEEGLLTWFSTQGQPLAVRQGHAAGKVTLRWTDQGLWSMGSDGSLLRWDADAVLAAGFSIAQTGAWSNLRVCADDARVVPVMPWPAPERVWAPAEACSSFSKRRM